MGRTLLPALTLWLVATAALSDDSVDTSRTAQSHCRDYTSSLLQRTSRREQVEVGAILTDDLDEAQLAQYEEQRAQYEEAQEPLSEEEKAEFLMMASFGPSRSALAAMGSATREDWVHAQMELEPTLHRSFYRARMNARAGESNVSALPRGPCQKGSRWHNFALSRKDEGLRVQIANSVVTVDGTFRTDLDPSFTGNGLDSTQGAALAPYDGYICKVDESVGGEVEVAQGSSCGGTRVTLPNPALWITDSSLSGASSLAFRAGPKAGVILLDETALQCTLEARPFLEADSKYYVHDPRVALLSNLVEEPAVGAFDEPYVVVASPDKHCRPAGSDITQEAECRSAAARLGLTYQTRLSDTNKPPRCISDGSGVWYNSHWRGTTDAAFQLICKRPCPVVAPTFVNQAHCRVVAACGGAKSIACGSPGEVENSPSLGHRYGFYLLDDHGQQRAELKRDPKYARDWDHGFDRHVVWTMIALQGQDQLRQRVAWALSQIFVTSVKGFGFERHNEMWLNFFDLFVRHAFGSFKDLVMEVTYNPIMAQYLTYWRSRSFDSDGKYPDENYARELMQLFTIGQWKLNSDGTAITAPSGEPLLTYDNEDIMNFARVFTGFEQQAERGNIERTGTYNNYIDPMRIVPEWHDTYPKPDLSDNYLGDLRPLCVDLPPRSFLQEGATFEFLGFAHDEASEVLELEEGSELYGALESVNFTKVLPRTLSCSGVQCDLDTVKVVRAAGAFYEFHRPTCVHLFHRNSRVVQQSSYRFGDLRYSVCANPDLREASTACCTPEGSFLPEGYANGEYVTFATAASRCELRGMKICDNSGPSAAATGDDDGITDVWTGRSCGMSIAVDAVGRVASQVDGKTKENWYAAAWANGSFPSPGACPTECHGLRVAAASGTVTAPFVVVGDHVELPEEDVDAADLGKVEFNMQCSAPAFVAFEALIIAPDGDSDSLKVEMDGDGEKRDWHTNGGTAWFWSSISPAFHVATGEHKVAFHGREDGILVKSVQLARGLESCKLVEATPPPARDSCVCHMRVEERSVFDHIPGPGDIRRRLFIGAFPPDKSVPVETSGHVKAYVAGAMADTSTIFEFEGRFYKNMETTVHVGNSFAFRNAPVFVTPREPTARAVHAEVEALIDHLVEHPNTPTFIAYRLIQRLVTSNPSGQHVEAVAEAFSTGNYNGIVYTGKRGDLKAAVAATLLHPRPEAGPASPSLLAQGAPEARQRPAFTQARRARSCANSRRNPGELSRAYSGVRSDHAPGTGHARSMLYSALGWQAKSSRVGEWMQIDLEAPEEISGVVTQGRSTGTWKQWVTSYKVNISADGVAWTAIDGTFAGNSDHETLVENRFPTPQFAKSVRILPQTWSSAMTMRAGLLVCEEAACSDWDVRLTNVQGSRGTPEVFFQGEFRPLCGYGWYWGSTETRLFCQALNATGGTVTKTQWINDVDAVEARDWQTIHEGGLTDRCRAGTAVAMEIECTGGSLQPSTCPVLPSPTPAPTPVPSDMLQLEVQTAARDFPGSGLSAFYLNGQSLEGPNSRGFNVIMLSTTGEVLSRSTWDVRYSRDDAKAFADMIHRAPFGARVVLSLRDRGAILQSNDGKDWTLYVKAAAEEALASLGASQFHNLDGDMPYALMAQVGFPAEAREIVGEKDDRRLLQLEAAYPKQPPPEAPVPPSGTGQCSNWDVRLRGVIGKRGVPEVFLSGGWHPVCMHYFDDAEATEFCKKLGADSGVLKRVGLGYDTNAVEIRTWGEIYKEGLTEWCQKGRGVSVWVECTGDLPLHSSCAEASVQECSYQPIPSEECPCEHGNHGSCDLAGCNLGILPGELCEADSVLPDGREEWNVDNCAEHYDVFKYACGESAPLPAPTPAPQDSLFIEVKSATYNAGSRGLSEFSLNGADLAGPNGAGINLVVLSSAGQVVSMRNFDLNNWDRPTDLNNTLQFVAAVDAVTPGSIILLSVKENAYTSHEEARVKDALESLGATRAHLAFRTPYALIVKKGSPGEGVHERLGGTRSYEVLTASALFSTTPAPAPAPTPAPVPTPAPAPIPASSLLPAARHFGKLREPVLKVMHFLRALEYQETDPERDILFDTLEYRIGQWMYMSPSVFNFYKPEYHPSSFNDSLVAPEFEIFTPPYAVAFLNGMIELINNGLSSCNGGFGETQFSCNEEQGRLAYGRNGTVQEVLGDLDLLLTAGRLGSAPEAEIVKAAYETAPEGEKLKAAQRAVLFTPQFNTQGDALPLGKRPPQEASSQASSTPRPYKAVVKLFFHGGMDSFNMLVPLDCPLLDEYRTVRSDIALDAATLQRITTSGQACSEFGIHPSLAVLKKLYDTGEAAFVTNIGGLVEPLTKKQFRQGEGRRCMGLFSHSDQILGAQTLQCQSGNAASRGAGGRLGDSLASQAEKFRTASFSVSGSAPWSQGFETHTEILDQSNGAVRLREYQSLRTVVGNVTQVKHGQIYSEEFVQQLGRAIDDSEELGKHLEASSLEAQWDTGYSLSRQLQQVAKVIKSKEVRRAERDLFFVGIGGFDHHNEVLDALTGRFTEINSAIQSFVDELKLMGMFDKVTLMTASDFGRTLTSNGAGSDHGWAGNHFIVGGAIKGGKVYNRFPDSLLEGNEQDAGRGRLIPKYPWESVELPVAQWMGLDAAHYAQVFPNVHNFNSSHLIQSSNLFE